MFISFPILKINQTGLLESQSQTNNNMTSFEGVIVASVAAKTLKWIDHASNIEVTQIYNIISILKQLHLRLNSSRKSNRVQV